MHAAAYRAGGEGKFQHVDTESALWTPEDSTASRVGSQRTITEVGYDRYEPVPISTAVEAGSRYGASTRYARVRVGKKIC